MTTNKEDLIFQQLKTMTAYFETKYKQEHNKYVLKILSDKIKCYQMYSKDPIKYYSCYRGIMKTVTQNHKSLSKSGLMLNNKLRNCVENCGEKSLNNEKFEECAKVECYDVYQKRIEKIYDGMYKIVLQ